VGARDKSAGAVIKRPTKRPPNNVKTLKKKKDFKKMKNIEIVRLNLARQNRSFPTHVRGTENIMLSVFSMIEKSDCMHVAE
jgi:hypothetical protein